MVCYLDIHYFTHLQSLDQEILHSQFYPIQYMSLFISLRYMLLSLSLLSCGLPSYLTQVTFKPKLLVLVWCPSAC